MATDVPLQQEGFSPPSVTDSEVESTLATGDQFTSLSLSANNSSYRLNATRQELEKWQLHHTVQLLRLELSQKNVIMESLRTEHEQQIEELKENLSEIECDKKLLQQRCHVLTKLHEDEKQDLRRQLSDARKAQLATADSDNLSAISEDKMRENIETALHQTLLTEERYQELIAQEVSSLNLSDLVQLRIYEATRPFINEGACLRDEVNKLQSLMKDRENHYQDINNKYVEQESLATSLQAQCDQLVLEKARLVTQTKSHNFKSEHYDIIKSERDSFEKELDTIKRTLVEKEIAEQLMKEEKERMQDELLSARHSLDLLKQDKEYLHKQANELSIRCKENEEKVDSLQSKLSDIKQSKEDLYKDFVRQRQEQKSDFETRLQQELESIRVKTNTEVDQLKIQTQEMYERERRALVQARDNAYSDRERAVSKQNELEDKHELLLNAFRQLQVSSDGRISELSSELQMKSFEFERVQLLYEEMSKSLKKSETEREQLREKLNTLSNESETVTRDLQSHVKELEMKLKDRTERLEGYEKLEHELDDVVLQAANIDDETDAERVLFSYGFGTSVPSSAKRRAQQSLQLARRVLKLERVNGSLRQQLESENRDKGKLKEKIKRLCAQYELSKQPQNYLIEAIKKRETQLEKSNNRNKALEAKNSELETSLRQLVRDKNKMAADLERLLSNNEELNLIKQMISSSHASGRSLQKFPRQPKDTSMSHHCQPHPTIFTQEHQQ